MTKQKFTIITNEICGHSSNGNPYFTTKLYRVTANTIDDILNSKYGNNVVFLFHGWPLQGEETFENEWDLPVIDI